MNKFKEYLSKTFSTVINLLKKYPLTLIICICLTLFLTIFIDTDVFKSSTIEKIALFGVMWAIGVIFIETLKLKNKKFTIASYVLTAIISFVFVNLLENVYGVFNEHVTRIMTGYGLISILLSMFFIIKKENITFQEYLLKIFNNAFNSSITYGILNIGMTLILVIFVELILDGSYGELLFRSQILLLGLFYFPAMLNSISDVKEKQLSSFIKVLVKYVLLPLVTIAMIIIYIYIAKILIQREMPSNIIFRILAGIFIAAFPIWNMVSYFKEQKIIYKISKILPYAYLPFIFLEIYSVGVRIIELGFTPVRYIGIAFIIFQIIVLLFTISKRKISLSYSFIVLSAIIFIACMTPLNFNTMSKLSQKQILVSILSEERNFDDLLEMEKEKVHSSYSYLTNNYGDNYIPKYIKEMNNEINSYSKVNLNYRNNEYISFSEYGGEIQVKQYASIIPIRMANSKYNNGNINLYDYDNNYAANVDIKTIIEKAIDENKKTSKLAENYILQNRYVPINEIQTLYITRLDITYNTSTNEVIHISLSGYLLKK